MKNISAILLGLFVIAAASGVHAQIEVSTDSGTEPEFDLSMNCAKCHRDIHHYWKDSLHAHALDDYIFQAAFMIAIKEKGDDARALCLGCHAPTTTVTGDLMSELPITSDAVTCDFCHRIKSVDLGEETTKVTLTSGDTKYGPLEPGKSSDAHPAEQSPLFGDSKLCATCHQWTNKQGIAIFDTYNEWLNGPFPEAGTDCQDCHMPLVEGAIVGSKPKKRGEKINSHNLSGGHSVVQVVSAARVNISSISQVAGGIRVMVEVSNIGSGHMIPTGIPSRALVLEVQLLDSRGNIVETDLHEFRRTILDKNHKELVADADIILDGALVSKDNRIPPGEKVAVPFDFATSPKKKYLVKATLRYKYTPLILKEQEITIDMSSDSRGF